MRQYSTLCSKREETVHLVKLTRNVLHIISLNLHGMSVGKIIILYLTYTISEKTEALEEIGLLTQRFQRQIVS